MFVTDLDHSLIKTDLLYESFFGALASRPLSAVRAVPAMVRGRSALKSALADIADVDPALLPYNEEVLEALRAARAHGEKTALVSASDARLVRQVAVHLDCFDEVHGSDATTNLKGPNKARFLAERYGDEGFAYVGDSHADLDVWDKADCVIAVGATGAFRAEIDRRYSNVTHLESGAGGTPSLLRSLRPHQWLKNILVFMPPLLAHSTDPAVWAMAILAFVVFCMTASSVYLLNDLLDLGPDRAHSRKRNRPFASGALRLTTGMILAPALLLVAVCLSLVFAPPVFLLVLAFYYAATLAYSLYLKRQLVVDIGTLAGLYTIRVLAGGAATAVLPSPWFLAFSGFIFISLASIKRQIELTDSLKQGRETIKGRAYETGDLPIVTMMALAAGYASIVILALYVDSEPSRELYSQPLALWGVCPVMTYWVSRLVMLAHRGRMDDDPIIFAVKDPISYICGVAVGLLLVVAAYG